MDITETRVGMPLEKFIAESKRHRFEILNAEKVELMPTGRERSDIMMLIYDSIRDYLKLRPIGRAFLY